MASPVYSTEACYYGDEDEFDDDYDEVSSSSKYDRYDFMPCSKAKGGAKSTTKAANKSVYSQAHVRNMMNRLKKFNIK